MSKNECLASHEQKQFLHMSEKASHILHIYLTISTLSFNNFASQQFCIVNFSLDRMSDDMA